MPRYSMGYRTGHRGWIYVIHIKDTEAYKIGLAIKDVRKRIMGIASIMPWPVEVILISQKMVDIEWHEHKLHEHFFDKRLRGEWFELDEKDITEIVDMLPGFLNIKRVMK